MIWAKREVSAMLDLVKQETERIDSRFLENRTTPLIRIQAAQTEGLFEPSCEVDKKC